MFTPAQASALHELFAPHRWLDDRVFLTKAGEVGVMLRLEGIDYECLTDATLEDQHGKLLAAERPFDDDFRTYQYFLKTEGADIPEPQVYENEVVNSTVKTRIEFLRAKPERLYSIALYRIILYKPQGWGAKLKSFSRHKLDRNRARLLSEIRSFQSAVNDLIASNVLARPDVTSFLRFLDSFDWSVANAERHHYDDHIDYWMCSTTPEPTPDGGLRFGRVYSDVLTMRDLPKQTWPNVLKDLIAIPGNFLLCTEYHRISNEKTVDTINNAQSHAHYAQWVKSPQAIIQLIMTRGKRDDIVIDESAKADVEDLAATIRRVKTDGDPMGRFSFTAIVFGKDADSVESVSAEAIKVIGNHEGSLVRETAFALQAWCSIIPGTSPKWKDRFRQRENLFPLSQYVDLSFVYGHKRGSRISAHLQKEYHLALETSAHTLYYANLHEGDLSDDLVIGKKGSGKSVFVNLRLDHAMKYNPYILILDGMGGSYRMLTQKYSGSYYELGVNGKWPFTINPLHLPDSAKTRQHLAILIRVCCMVGGFKPDAEKNQIIYEEACRVMDSPVEQRRLSALRLPRDIALYLAPWIGNGQYSFVFDNDIDTFNLQRLQGVDFSQISTYKDILQPLLFHLLYLWDDVVENPGLLDTVKLLVFEEGWMLAEIQELRNHLEKTVRTGRKLNSSAIFVSQSIVELDRLGMLDLANELFQRKYLLAQPGANYEYYAKRLGMTEGDVAEFKKTKPKGEVFELSPNGSKRLIVNLAPSEYWLYAKSPKDDALRGAAIAEHGFEGGMKVLAEAG
jgi:type IV secretion system protein VirB4